MIRFYMPWKNLGCLGVSVGRRFYADVCLNQWCGRFSPQLYWRIGEYRYRFNFRTCRLVPDSSNPRRGES